jgi:hypothetical protein
VREKQIKKLSKNFKKMKIMVDMGSSFDIMELESES